jgi:hypothetical protein
VAVRRRLQPRNCVAGAGSSRRVSSDVDAPLRQILKVGNYADLFRIKGITGQTAELQEAAGVNTVAELAQRNASNLQVKLQEVNDRKKPTGKVPSEKHVAEWIEEAKTLPKRVTY